MLVIHSQVQLWADLRQRHAMAAAPGTLESIAAARESDTHILRDSREIFDLGLLSRAVRYCVIYNYLPLVPTYPLLPVVWRGCIGHFNSIESGACSNVCPQHCATAVAPALLTLRVSAMHLHKHTNSPQRVPLTVNLNQSLEQRSAIAV